MPFSRPLPVVDMQITVRVQREDFNVADESRRLSSTASGAIVQFIGVMRERNDGDQVALMELEHYPGMTESSIRRIIDTAGQRWTLQGVTVVHRVGEIRPGEQIVLVAVAAAHRGEAFAACEFVMDYLKCEAPFWKKERLADGSSRWVDSRESDTQARQRWSQPAPNG